MTETATLAALLLLALAVGAAIPALLQLRRTLRSAELFFESTRTSLHDTLDEVRGAAVQVRAIAGHVERVVDTTQTFVDAAGGLVDALKAVPAAIRAIRGRRVGKGLRDVAGARRTRQRGENPET
ncbi:MAG TPA: hypothetical protein VIX13_03730 [Candidatus Eisenbacteria bacterium]